MPELQNHILPCVSYAPFRRAGHTPFDPEFVITRAELEEDLRLIRSISPCIRTYGLDHGLDQVPEIAAELGLRLRMGVWISADPIANQKEIERAVELSVSHGHAIEAIVVGNEVLLRGELSPQALGQLLEKVNARVEIPITYADVWEFWRQNAQHLMDHVDFVAIHILPYWEDEPVAVEEAVEHVYRIADQVRSEFEPRPVWVAETGWPAEGRPRGPASPGPQAQDFFVRSLLARHAQTPLDFNFIEAFDQPWKRSLEGAMGGAWGLFEANGQQRALDQKPSTLAERNVLFLLGGATLLLGLAFMRFGRPSVTWAWWATVWILAVGFVQIERAFIWNLSFVDSLWAAICLVASLGLSIVLARRLYRAGVSGTSPDLERPQIAQVLSYAWAACVVIDGYLMVSDGRYRPLPWPLLLGPVVLGLSLVAQRAHSTPDSFVLRSFAWSGLLLGGLVLWSEGIENNEAVFYVSLLVVWSLMWTFPWRYQLDHASSSRGASS